MRKYFLPVVAMLCVTVFTSCTQNPTQTAGSITSSQNAVVNVPMNVALLVKGDWDQPIEGRCEIADVSKISSDPIITPRILKELKVTVKNAKGEIVGMGNLNTADNFKKRDKKAIHRIRCKC